MNILKANMPKNWAGKDLLKEKLCFLEEIDFFVLFCD
tara:strand:- start:94 stop:204 length:111 start_codon:yes stop_codon:yes gene_type:complete